MGCWRGAGGVLAGGPDGADCLHTAVLYSRCGAFVLTSRARLAGGTLGRETAEPGAAVAGAGREVGVCLRCPGHVPAWVSLPWSGL
jgi:hypothetical protein